MSRHSDLSQEGPERRAEAGRGDRRNVASAVAMGLIETAVGVDGTADFVAEAGRVLVAEGLGVERVFVSLQTLHPAFRARTYLWSRETGHVGVREWPHGLRNRPGYYDSPDFHVHSTKRELRIARLQSVGEHRCDLYGKLKERGYTDYLMVPLRFSEGVVNTFSVATKRRSGFSETDLAVVCDVADTLAVILERFAALETTASTLATYLGRGPSREVLRGRIRAGEGRLVTATIAFADLHDFTAHARRLDPAATVRLLNGYFDCLVGPIERHGGLVLKFIGDALLAFFPEDNDERTLPDPLAAVREIQRHLDELNSVRTARGEPSLRHGMCLHFGTFLYGNVGSSERLDFTVIGDDVNVAARGVEAARSLNANYLFTEAFVARFGNQGLLRIGRRALRNVLEPVTLYRLIAEDESDRSGSLRDTAWRDVPATRVASDAAAPLQSDTAPLDTASLKKRR